MMFDAGCEVLWLDIRRHGDPGCHFMQGIQYSVRTSTVYPNGSFEELVLLAMSDVKNIFRVHLPSPFESVNVLWPCRYRPARDSSSDQFRALPSPGSWPPSCHGKLLRP